ncbi:unnamed protein product [Ixodes persulcatus]
MLQYQLTPEDKQQVRVDVSGKCQVSFKTNGNHVTKTKSGCTHPDKAQFFHPNPIQSPTIVSQSESAYELLPDLTAPKSVHIKEDVTMFVNVWKEANIRVTAAHTFKLEGTSPSVKSFVANTEVEVIQQLTAGKKLVEDTIVARPEIKKCTKNCKSLAENVKLFEANLRPKSLATLKSSVSFLRLLQSFREASEKDIHAVLKSGKNKKIVPQLLDLTAAAQTLASVKASLKFLDFNSENDLAERFLVSLVAASHPSSSIISEILAVAQKDLKNEKNKAAAIATLGALIKTYCRAHPKCAKQGVSTDLTRRKGKAAIALTRRRKADDVNCANPPTPLKSEESRRTRKEGKRNLRTLTRSLSVLSKQTSAPRDTSPVSPLTALLDARLLDVKNNVPLDLFRLPSLKGEVELARKDLHFRKSQERRRCEQTTLQRSRRRSDRGVAISQSGLGVLTSPLLPFSCAEDENDPTCEALPNSIKQMCAKKKKKKTTIFIWWLSLCAGCQNSGCRAAQRVIGLPGEVRRLFAA